MKYILYILLLFILAACSTTSNLPEDEVLYTGIKSITIDDKKGTDTEAFALEELDGVLAYAPNNSLFGSSSIRTPLPIGLWVYNNMAGKEYKGIKKWFFNTFSSVPRTISSASPDTRVKVANNVLANYGYFHNTVDYELINGKDPRKQKIAYKVHLGPASMLDTLKYIFPAVEDSIIKATEAESYIAEGKQFTVPDLQNEKMRLSTEFHNNGFYYYRPDYIKYIADTINYGGKVRMLVAADLAMPERAKRQYKVGRMNAFIRKNSGTRTQAYDDTLFFKRLTLGYQGKHVPIKPRVMFRGFKFWTGQMYNESKVSNTINELSNMGIFSNVAFSFTPADSTDTCSVLDCRLDCTMDKLIDTELEFSFTQKSNAQLGPDVALTFSKRNAFRFGETATVKLRGAYFWKVGDRGSKQYNNMDSYMYGIDGSLTYPWLCFPWVASKFYRLPTSTKFSASFTRENVAKAYRFNKFSVGVTYNRQLTPFVSHSFSPIDVTLVDLRDMDLLNATNQMLALWLNDEFVPAMKYVVTYDNSKGRRRNVTTRCELTFKESGNLISAVQAIAGKDFNTPGKNFVFKRYAQFFKGVVDLRNNFWLSPRSSIATHLLIGGQYSYGNSGKDGVPTSEAFYCGGANSVRAFATRSLGPGPTTYRKGDPYFFHGGDAKFEASIEYRFPMFGNLNGALFVDAGNVWLLSHDDSGMTEEEILANFEKGSEMYEYLHGAMSFKLRNFPRQLALGTGFGFRYDLEFLVLRLDVGIAIHAPFKTSRKGYYNIPHFWKDGVAFHFAVGYPF